MSDALQVQILIDVVGAFQTSRYTSAAAVAIYLYNILITLDLEVSKFSASSSGKTGC